MSQEVNGPSVVQNRNFLPTIKSQVNEAATSYAHLKFNSQNFKLSPRGQLTFAEATPTFRQTQNKPLRRYKEQLQSVEVSHFVRADQKQNLEKSLNHFSRQGLPNSMSSDKKSFLASHINQINLSLNQSLQLESNEKLRNSSRFAQGSKITSGEINFNKFKNPGQNSQTRNVDVYHSYPVTTNQSTLQQQVVKTIVKNQLKIDTSKIDKHRSQDSSVVKEFRESESGGNISLYSPNTSQIFSNRETSLLIGSRDTIDRHLSRILNGKIPIQKFDVNDSKFTLNSGQETLENIATRKSQVDYQLHRRRDVDRVSKIIENRLNHNQSSKSTYKPLDHVTQSTLFQLFSERLEGRKDRHNLIKSLTFDKKIQKSNPTKLPNFAHISSQRSFGEEKNNKYEQILVEKRKIELSAIELEADSMLGNQTQLRETLHGTVQGPKKKKNKNEEPIRVSFQSSQIMKQINYLQEMQRREDKRNKVQKYAGLGEIGEYYAKKEVEEEQYKKEMQVKCFQAAKAKKFLPWTKDRLIHKMSSDNKDKIQFLMSSEKQRPTPVIERKTKQFVEKVKQYADELKNNEIIIKQDSSPRSQMTIGQKIAMLVLQKSLSKFEPKSPKLKKSSPASSPTMTKFVRRLSTKTNMQYNKFESFLDDKTNQFDMQAFIHHLVGKVAFQEVCKQTADLPHVMNQLLEEDPRQSYFLQCKLAIEPAYDILNKIKNQILHLEEYKLHIGHCKGFMNACQLESDLITHLYIDNCGLNDESLSYLLSGLLSQRKITVISLKRQEIGSQSAEKLRSIFQKVIPKQLEELRLQNCVVTKENMLTILKNIENGSQLSKLGLIDQVIDIDHIKVLCQFIRNSKYLTSIDVKGSKILPKSFTVLLQAISESRKLQNVNISNIALSNNSNYGIFGTLNDIAIRLSSQLSNYSQDSQGDKQNFGTHPKPSKKSRKKSLQPEAKLTDLFKALITKNNKLQHLDLSNLGLSSDLILDIVNYMRKSESIVAVHLTGNMGLNSDIFEQIQKILNATFEQPLKIDSFQQVIDRFKDPKQLPKRQHKVIDALNTKEIQNMKRIETHLDNSKVEIPQERHLILTRKLGHLLEMPGSQHWQIFRSSETECWVCDRKLYTLFFWSPEIGRIEGLETQLTPQEQHLILSLVLKNRNTNKLREQQRLNVTQNLVKPIKLQVYDEKVGQFRDQSSQEEENSELFISSDESIKTTNPSALSTQFPSQHQKKQTVKSDGVALVLHEEKYRSKLHGRTIPMIYGQFNNWQPQPMLLVSKLSEAVDPSPLVNIIEDLKAQGLCRQNVVEFKDLDKREKIVYKKMLDEHSLRYQRTDVWTKQIFKLLVYKHPHCTSLKSLRYADVKDLYVAASFIGCGKQNYIVQYGSRFHFQQTFTSYRKEDVVFPQILQLNTNKKERNPNVFKNWITDTPGILKFCMNYDFENWKLAKFVKDAGDQSEIISILNENYAFLKDVYLTVACHSSYPCIASQDFCTFIQESGFLDSSNLTMGMVETQFIAARTDVEKLNKKVHGQNQLDINRFEFLECLVRVANCKFKQSGLVPTIGQAVTKLIGQIREKFQLEPSQSFRKDFLWIREVNLTLDANKRGIKKLYELYANNNKMRKVSISDALKLMMFDTKIKLIERDARACYGLSQQTCTDIVTMGNQKLNHLDLLEFTEMIARVADRYFSEQETYLHDKINYVLDEWLPLVNEERKEPLYYAEDESDEYDDQVEQN